MNDIDEEIEKFRNILSKLDEVDRDLVRIICYGVCKVVHQATNKSCIFNTDFDERKGEYGPEWVVKFIHGDGSGKGGKVRIPLIVTKFIDTFFEKVNMEVEEDEDDESVFRIYIKKKMFDLFIVEVGGRIQKVRPVDPEYCGFSVEEQKKHANYMIRDIDRIQKKIYKDLTKRDD